MKSAATICSAILMLAITAFAQMEMPKPGPEHKKLDMFVGSWILEGDAKPTPMGPGGKVTGTEKCEWMEGQFFLVCHSTYKAPIGNGSAISILGYSAETKTYTYREFNSWGEFEDSKGALDGSTFVWSNEETMGGTPVKGRYTMKITSPTSYDFMYEMSQDGTKWTTIMDGKASKKS